MNLNEKRQVNRWLAEYYQLVALEIERIDGWGSRNYKIRTRDRNYILKVYENDLVQRSIIEDENDLLRLFNERLRPEFSMPLYSIQGNDIELDKVDNVLLRLLSFVNGQFWAETEIKKNHIQSLGRLLGEMDLLLKSEQKNAIAAKNMDWNPLRLPALEKKLVYIKDPLLRNKIHYHLNYISQHWLAIFYSLPQQLIYNDAHEWNLLTGDEGICGVIDLGDMIYSLRICDLTVAASYLLMNSKEQEPLNEIVYLIRAYDEINPILSEELNAIYPLVALRTCMSLLNGAELRLSFPGNDYLDISTSGAIKAIDYLLGTNPIHFTRTIRRALGRDPEKISKVHLKEALKKRRAYTPSVLSLSYVHPLHISHAAFQYIYDKEGNCILDAYNNIIQLGHCHPAVVTAANKTISRINTNTRYVYDELGEYSERLLSHFPHPLNKVFFVNSGSAASDLAIRLAMNYTGRRKIISLEHGYHGNSFLDIEISPYKYMSPGGRSYSDYSLALEMPDSYRGSASGHSEPGISYAKMAMKSIEISQDAFAAFIAEPIVGCGGQVPLAEGYLRELYPYLRSKGIVCISDEVQVGFARLGKWYWGFEMHDVIPDIVILGKPIGNGHPMAAVVTTDAIASAFNNGMEFFSSFGGNPVSCAIGLAVLDTIRQEELQEHAKVTGTLLLNELSNFRSAFECIGDVRGSGLFIGIDLVKDRVTKAYDESTAYYLSNALRNQNVLVSTDGPGNQVIKIKPPLCFNDSNADELLTKIYSILKNSSKT